MSPVLTQVFAGLFALASTGFASAAGGLIQRSPSRASTTLKHVDHTTARHVTFPRRSLEGRSAELPSAEFVASFTGKVSKTQHKKDILRSLRSAAGINSTSVIDGSDLDEEYITEITVGGQTFYAIVDTGSADTWLVESGFLCVDSASNAVTEEECNFGPTFDTNASSTFVDFPDHNFNISYGDGEFLNGPVGYDTVAIGGLSVTNQTLPLVNYSYWNGDGISSGLIGLAHPDLTSVYDGDDPSVDEWFGNSLFYNPFFYTAVSEGAVSEPYFSIALNRGNFSAEENSTFDPNLGYLAFGGIAPVAVTNTSTTVPIQGYSISTFTPSNDTNSTDFTYFYYTIDVQSFVFNGSDTLGDISTDNIILDTGTTLNYFPTNVADLYASKFVPAGAWNDDVGGYVVDCDAEIPEMSVVINGTTFTIDTADQILPLGTDDSGAEVCIVATTDGGANEPDNTFILGDVFLHNVVSTFDIGAFEITLTQREAY